MTGFFVGSEQWALALHPLILQLLSPALDIRELRLPFHLSCPSGSHLTPSGFCSVHKAQTRNDFHATILRFLLRLSFILSPCLISEVIKPTKIRINPI